MRALKFFITIATFINFSVESRYLSNSGLNIIVKIYRDPTTILKSELNI
jgi:hypothetical protein